MFGTLVRVALLRVLPRRLLPVLTAWQILSMFRNRRARSRAGDARDRSTGRRSR